MASGKSQYLENAVLNAALENTSFAPATPTLYAALTTASPTATSTGSTIVEPTGNYARIPILSVSGWSPTPVTAGTAANSGTVQFWPTPATGGPFTITSVAICDAVTAGNLLYYGDLTGGAKTVNTGDQASIAIGALTISES